MGEPWITNLRRSGQWIWIGFSDSTVSCKRCYRWHWRVSLWWDQWLHSLHRQNYCFQFHWYNPRPCRHLDHSHFHHGLCCICIHWQNSYSHNFHHCLFHLSHCYLSTHCQQRYCLYLRRCHGDLSISYFSPNQSSRVSSTIVDPGCH